MVVKGVKTLSKVENLLPCPFCGGNFLIAVCDDEGNIHNEAGYEQDPWSGLGYQIVHSVEENKDCPIAKYEEDDAIMGIFIFDTREEAIEAINRRTQPENKQYDPKFCTGCRSVDNDADDYPCNECRRAYTDKFEPEQEEVNEKQI